VAGRRRTWLDGRVDVLLATLHEYGMSASVVSAAELIQERVQWVAAHLRVTPATARRYLTDEAVRDLARTMAVTVADEAPGADLLASPRTAAVPVPVLGRCIADLSEAIVRDWPSETTSATSGPPPLSSRSPLRPRSDHRRPAHSQRHRDRKRGPGRAVAAAAAEPRGPLSRSRGGAGASRRSLAGRVRSRPRNSACRHLRRRRHGRTLLR
jgi:hypothetical protein